MKSIVRFQVLLFFTLSLFGTGWAQTEVQDRFALFDKAAMQQFLGVPEMQGFRRTYRDSKIQQSVTVEWDKENALDLRKKSAKEMRAYMQKKMRGENVEMPKADFQHNVLVTLSKAEFSSPEEAFGAFEASMKALGASTKEDKPVNVPDLGDAAQWTPHLQQVSVLGKNRIFHVLVEAGPDKENKTIAIELAKTFLESL